MTDLLLLFLGAAFVNQLVLVKLFGLAPFVGASRTLEAAQGIAVMTGIVLTISAVLNWGLQQGLLAPLGLAHLRILVFLVVIAAVACGCDLALARRRPPQHRALGAYLPLVLANCMLLGVALVDAQTARSLLATLVHALGAALGFAVALVLFSAMRERLETADVPVAWRGLPIVLTTAGLLSLAFLGFAGMIHDT
ncbi:electron transport complex protein RnfA [Arenimonas oryziterrae]|uniref:Electron transport complex protein RnfA n=1 Tax=Arenimonas oryziterrae DSM 21050 = YC6267 TaxID=1121015 RepID=A0A091APT4_9GAMM|nr:Rnf-Nqr domain containing protein [Arenimonas oryziterrae]KFN41157.1 hypothetical protein N789_04530 [Arenimonas oryziterrae DSM 21050 = YC6267]